MTKRHFTNGLWFVGPQVGVTTLVFGNAGGGKTTLARTLAETKSKLSPQNPWPFLVMSADGEAADIGGYPVVNEVVFEKKTYKVMDKVLPRALQKAMLTHCVVLMDDVGDWSPAHQAVAQEIFRKGIPGSCVMAAANPPEVSTAGFELSMPLTNRLHISEWEPMDSTFLEGLQNGGRFPTPEVPIVPDNWDAFKLEIGPLFAGFLKSFPDKINDPPRDVSAGCGKPFATPRSWENALKMAAGVKAVNGSEQMELGALAGCVGLAIAEQFWAWARAQEIPDPADILKNPKGWKIPRRGDLAFATKGAILGYLARNTSWENWELAKDVCEYLYESGNRELAVLMHADLFLGSVKPHGEPKIRTNATAKALCAGMTPYLLGR